MINEKLKKNIFISSLILFLIGGLFHFAYNFSGNNFIIGLITPVNESTFEHLKLALFPIFLWWLIFYLLKKRKYSLDKDKWFLGCLVAMILSIIIISNIYYFVRCGLGKELIVVDIGSLYVALLFAQFTGYHIYNFSSKRSFVFSIIIIFILLISFMILTVTPLKLPLFIDSKSHTYGINR